MTAGVSCRRFRLPLHRPFRTAAGRIEAREGFAIALRTEHAIGVGEATPLSGWTEDIGQTQAALPNAGTEAVDHWRRSLPAHAPAARHAIQLAVTDLGAQRAGQPLSTYLRGTGCLTHVPVNATVGEEPIPEVIERVRDAAEAGFGTVKVKVGGRSLRDTIERIDALGDLTERVDIRLDANRAWLLEEAQAVIDAASNAGIRLVEEPLADPTPEALGSLERGAVDIAIDETVIEAGIEGVEPWLPAVDAVLLKPMAIGGLDRSLEVAALARKHDADVIVSNTVDGVIARAAAVHLAAALRCDRAAGLATGSLLAADLAADIVPVESGRIPVPTEPGIGTLGPWDRTAGGGTVA